jgi:hypothetical protein
MTRYCKIKQDKTRRQIKKGHHMSDGHGRQNGTG